MQAEAQLIADAAPRTGEGRIPSLDGWRAVAIALVLLSHQTGALGFREAVRSVGGPVGNLGVRIFFVMSGFLITHLLLKELDRTGRINLRGFWLKRVSRLLPSALLLMAAIYLAAALGYVRLQAPWDYVFPLTFTMNYYPWRGWYWVHLWSLSVQMQFYLVWPLLILAVGRGRVLHLSLAVLALGPIIRIATFNLLPIWYTQGHSLETVIDAFAAGALMAVLRRPLSESQLYRHFLTSPAIPALAVLVLLMNMASQYGKVLLVMAGPINLALAVLIDRSTRITADWWGRLLASRPAVLLGAFSYSLYVWQQPFVNTTTITPPPYGLILALIVSWIVYRFVENPVALWGRKMAGRQGFEPR